MFLPRVPLVAVALLFWARSSEAALRTYNFTIHCGSKAPGTVCRSQHVLHRSTEYYTDGFPRKVYLINGLQPGPLIEIDEGDELEVFVKNELPVDSTIHWHGELHHIRTSAVSSWASLTEYTDRIGLLQRGTPQMDGVPGVTQVSLQFRHQ
jgi:FtsP/CotA-like multicopper oxidase with cupredoxin domain